MVTRDALISKAYLGEQKRLHRLPQGYGGKGSKWAPTVAWVREHFDAGSVLDYGCGQGSLARVLKGQYRIHCREYDPAIAGKDALPSFADVVVCTDVLEHIEPERLPAVLGHLRALARKVIFLVVNLREANKTLSDGRNAHLIIESAEWWRAQVEAAGLTVVDLPDLPMAQSLAGKPEKQRKCWVAVARP